MKRHIKHLLFLYTNGYICIMDISKVPLKYIKRIIQRNTRGYASDDVGDFDKYLSYIIFNGVKELKECIGHPTCLKNKKEWDDILDTISFAFEMKYKNIIGDTEYIHTDDEDLKEFYNKYDIHIITKEEDKRIKKGMKLFIKYFDALWS